MNELLVQIKTIQALLHEEGQLMACAANPPAAFTGSPSLTNFKARTRLIQVKALLKNYSDREIELARHWDKLREELAQSACRLSGSLSPQKPAQKAEDDFWQVAIFIYLLLKDRPMEAILSTYLGPTWSTLLLFIDNPSASPSIPAQSDGANMDTKKRRTMQM